MSQQLENWQKINGELGWQANWVSVSEDLNRRGIYTATGLDFTPVRAKSSLIGSAKNSAFAPKSGKTEPGDGALVDLIVEDYVCVPISFLVNFFLLAVVNGFHFLYF